MANRGRISSRVLPIVLAMLACIIGCEINKTGVIDSKGTPPFLSDETLSPDSTNIDTQIPQNGRYTITTTVRAKVIDPDGPNNVSAVMATVILPRTSDVILRAPLHDDGIPPDPVAGDGVYSGQLQYLITRPQSGRQRIQIGAQDREGLQGNIIERSFYAARNNSPPSLSHLVAPDTVTLPNVGSILIPMNIQAVDSDGLADITDVFFKSLDSSQPNTRFYLYDDGKTEHGDMIAGDAIFSIIIQLNASNPRRTYRFAFQAFDTFGDSSGVPLIHPLVVR